MPRGEVANDAERSLDVVRAGLHDQPSFCEGGLSIAVVERRGLWPGVVAFANDADLWCVRCAEHRYGNEAVQDVVKVVPGYQRHTDHEGNPLNVVLYGSEDVHGEHCAGCGVALCDEECICSCPEQAEH